MEDNWSQVRFAAAQATRRVYDIVKTDNGEERRYEIDQLLIPRICFNRHYMADGIRNYNQETWKLGWQRISHKVHPLSQRLLH